MADWTSLLEHSNPTIPFSTAAETALLPLAEHCLITVAGPDATRFLQGQCTCDFDAIAAGAALPGAHCNPKGRMITSFFAAATGPERVTLRVHRSVAEQTLAALGKYIVFSKAEIAVDDTLVGCLLLNPDEPPAALPAPGNSTTIEDGQPGALTLINHGDGLLECWAGAERQQALIEQNRERVLDPRAWNAVCVSRGWGEVRGETSEVFLPQEINLQLTDGVSFTKGCYTGQEVVARLHYRGNLKKHMYAAHIATSADLQPGRSLYTEDGSALGQLVLAGPASEGGCEALILCKDAATASETVKLAPESGEFLSWLPLPYAIHKGED